MVDIKDGRYFSAFWFLSALDGDWLGILWRDEGKPFVFDYRFRTYEDDAVFDSKDSKRLYRIDFLVGDEEAFCKETVGKLVRMLLELGYSDAGVQVVEMSTSKVDEVWDKLKGLPWIHTQSTPEGDEPQA